MCYTFFGEKNLDKMKEVKRKAVKFADEAQKAIDKTKEPEPTPRRNLDL